MENFVVIADSACDLPLSKAQAMGIHVVPFQITFEGTKYYVEHSDITLDEFYKKLRTEDVVPKTSLPSINDYYNEFKKHAEKGLDMICVCITSKFSGSYQSALNARDLMAEEMPERKIHVVDSYCVTGTQAALLSEILKMKENGMTLDEVVLKVEAIKNTGQIFVLVDTLKYLEKNGRIGKAAALAGSLLSVKPLLVFKDGELHAGAKARGRKKAMAELGQMLAKAVEGNRDKYTFVLTHGDVIDDAKEMAAILERDHGIKLDYEMHTLGITIGSHAGPGTLALGYLGKHDCF